jgi:outer membrane protein
MKRLTIPAIAVVTALTTNFSPVVLAHEAGDIILRVGATQVAPDDSSSVISTTSTGPLAGTSVSVDKSTQLGLNLVWMWTDSVGLEVLAATPFDHDLRVSGLDQYGFSTTDLGSAKQLPPTLSALYFFGSSSSRVRPYIGAGINYTTFFSKDFTSQAETELGANGLDLDDSWGLAGRAGIDIDLSDKWLLNASVWTIDIDTDASFNSALGRVNASVDIDPLVYMISLGYQF